MSFFDNMFDFEFPLFQETAVLSALSQGEAAAMHAIQDLTEPLSLQEAAPCLHKTLVDGSPELFQQILEHCEPGECMEQHFLSPLNKKRGLNGYGSILMLAAMLDRPRHAQLLLEHGYDCNGASLELAAFAHRNRKFWPSTVPPHARYCGTFCNQIFVSTHLNRGPGISCATPLAAALLCGSLQTAQVLLKWPGIWKGESTAVCRAAVLILEGHVRQSLTPQQQSNQLEILRLIFCPDEPTLPPVDTFLRTVYLQPVAFVDICSTRTLRCQLESGACSTEDGTHMLEILGHHTWWPNKQVNRTTAGKLLLLKQYYPALCRTSWASGIFLRECFSRCWMDLPYQTLMNAWKQLCGKQRDLTWLDGSLWYLNLKELRQFLSAAEEGGTLIMDADAIGGWQDTPYRATLELLNRVHFRYRHTKEISALTKLLIRSHDLRILQHAAKHGFFLREDSKVLMEELLQTEQTNQEVRTAILTYAKKEETAHPTEQWNDPHRWSHWCSWNSMQEGLSQEDMDRLLHQTLSEEDCLWLLFHLHQYLEQDFFVQDLPLQHKKYPSLESNSLLAISCCAQHTQALQLIKEYLPHNFSAVARVSWGNQLSFQGTPLALSAALGQTEHVQLLLDSSLHPNEEGAGIHSYFTLRHTNFFEENVPITPLLAAILFGEEETAKLLIRHGATCDFSRPSHRKILALGSEKSLALAETLPDVGFEHIPEEELENLRLLTGKYGEKTHFWTTLEQSSRDGELFSFF